MLNAVEGANFLCLPVEVATAGIGIGSVRLSNRGDCTEPEEEEEECMTEMSIGWVRDGGFMVTTGDCVVGLRSSPGFLDFPKKAVVSEWGTLRLPGDLRACV